MSSTKKTTFREWPLDILIENNSKKFKIFNDKFYSDSKKNFYIILTPRSLHLLRPCLNRITSGINIMLILNGTETWESNYIKKNFQEYPNFKLKLDKSMKSKNFKSYPHGTVLDFLFNINKNFFGIIDFDCFVMDKNIFNSIKLDKCDLVASPFIRVDKKSSINTPATYFLFFNTPLVNYIRNKYSLSCGWYFYKNLSKYIKEKLRLIGFNYSDGNKIKVFDTLELIFLMALCEGFNFKILKNKSINLFRYYKLEDIKKFGALHVGAVSYTWGPIAIFSTYFHLRVLDKSEKILKDKYKNKFKYKNYKDIINLYPEKKYIFERADILIDKIIK